MNVSRRPPAHTDERGVITDLHVGQPVNALTTVTCVKGAIRGNHFHKLTTQFTYVLSGRLRYVGQSQHAPVEECTIAAGDLVTSLPLESHAFEALEDSVLLAFCHGPRAGMDYEKDTYRLAEPLIPTGPRAVAQVSKPAVSPISKSAGRTTSSSPDFADTFRTAQRPAGLETRDTADLAVCATP